MGRDGVLDLAFAQREVRTVLTSRRFRLPLQALEPMALDDGAAMLMLLNPTGGIVGGDTLETRVALGPGARVCLTTPAATRVYRSAGPCALSRFTASLADGSRLELIPDHLIPSPGARLHQLTRVTLGAGAAVLLVDAWATGRVARAERWQFHELDVTLSVSDAQGPLLVDRARLDGSPRDGLGAAEGHPYIATFAAIAPGERSWNGHAAQVASVLESLADESRAGVSVLARGGLLARLLCPSAPALERAVAAVWAACRRSMFGLPPLALRKL